jgi:chromosome segregation ATPase
MNKLTLVAVAVLCAMPTGYRRAGFSLKKGDNALEVNQEQFKALDADSNLTVTIEGADSVEITAESISSTSNLQESHDLLLDEIALLKDEKSSLNSKVAALTALCETQQEDIKELEEQLATALAAHQEAKINIGEIGKVNVKVELDVSSAPHELHHWIAVIDDLNNEVPLTKKPNCDHLTITVEDEEITPSAAERDAAWVWYQENVVITEIKESE